MSANIGDFGIRNLERYGGREAVGSALWLEHCSGLVVPSESGEEVITPDDLRADEVDLSQNGYILPHKLSKAALDGLSMTQLLRNYLLPALPLRISGAPDQSELVLATEVSVFSVPRELTRSAGTLRAESSDGPETGRVPTFSVRFVPRVGEIETLGIYPRSTLDDYAINAFEIDNTSLRAVISGRVLIECFRQHQENLPPQIAPHQF